jgi:hypothetical protein
VGNFVYVIEQDSASSANLLGFSENPGDRRADAAARGDDQFGQCSIERLSHRGESRRTAGGQDGDPSLCHRSDVEPGGDLHDWKQRNCRLAPGTLTEAGPMGMAFDLSGKYLYVTAYTANTLDGYTMGAAGCRCARPWRPVCRRERDRRA